MKDINELNKAFSFTIDIKLDNTSIKNLKGKSLVILNFQTESSYGIWQNIEG